MNYNFPHFSPLVQFQSLLHSEEVEFDSSSKGFAPECWPVILTFVPGSPGNPGSPCGPMKPGSPFKTQYERQGRLCIWQCVITVAQVSLECLFPVSLTALQL